MIKTEHTYVYGWEAAIRGMRNPMNSWDKSDSLFHCMVDDDRAEDFIGENDLKLMKNLSKAGTDHSKYLRMINVTVDILAPRYWWTEYDTYKVGTVANSCSTMHRLTSKPIELSDFSIDDETLIEIDGTCYWSVGDMFEYVVDECETLRQEYLSTNDKKYWRALIQILPQSYNQKRTVQLNYQVLKSMYHARKNHKLDEWRDFCKWCETLPYFKEICIDI